MIFDFVLERYPQIIATGVALLVFFILKYFTDSIVNRFGQKTQFTKARVQLVRKYIDFLLGLLAAVVIISIWGVKPDQIFLFISSILTVIGVAFFAQWSILSNVTAGIFSLQDRGQNSYLGQRMPYRGRNQGYQLLLYPA